MRTIKLDTFKCEFYVIPNGRQGNFKDNDNNYLNVLKGSIKYLNSGDAVMRV